MKKSGFKDWWFINGGSLNQLWKERKFTQIKDLAFHLPVFAWTRAEEEGFRAGFERAIMMLRSKETRKAEIDQTLSDPSDWADWLQNQPDQYLAKLDEECGRTNKP